MGNTRFGWHSGVVHCKQILLNNITADSLFKFSGVLTSGKPLYDTDQSLVTQSGAIAVQTPAGTKYMPLYTHP